MNYLQATILGVLQGATEFLPVSSSGHLLVARELVGVQSIPLLYDVLLHVATLLAVVVVLRRQVGAFLLAIARWLRGTAGETDRMYLRLIPVIVVTTLITGGFGLGLDALLDIRNPQLASGLFLVTAMLLILTRWARGTRGLASIGWWDALALGVAQGFGVPPGISRSGITISAALYRAMDRGTAGEYSFPLSIPAILGALILTMREAGELGAQVGLGPVIVGCIVAALTGYLALTGLLRLVRAGRIALFAFYLIPLGIWGLVYFA